MKDHENEERSQCTICMEEYDQDKKYPMIMHCGHTFCKTCMEAIDRCSLCKEKKGKIVNNYALIDALELIKLSEKKKKGCENHNFESKGYYCLEDECSNFLCSNCLINHLDQQHRIQKINENIYESYTKIKECYSKNVKKNLFEEIKICNQNFIQNLRNKKDEIVRKEQKKINEIFEENIKILKVAKENAEKSLSVLNQNIDSFIDSYKEIDSSIIEFIGSYFHPVINDFKNENLSTSKQIEILKLISDKDEFSKIKKFSEILESQEHNFSSSVISRVNEVFEKILQNFSLTNLEISVNFKNSLTFSQKPIKYNENFSYSQYNIQVNSCFENLAWYVRRLFNFTDEK